MDWIDVKIIPPPVGIRLLVCGVWTGNPKIEGEALGLHKEGLTIARYNEREEEWIKDNDSYVDHIVTHYAYMYFPNIIEHRGTNVGQVFRMHQEEKRQDTE